MIGGFRLALLSLNALVELCLQRARLKTFLVIDCLFNNLLLERELDKIELLSLGLCLQTYRVF